MTRPLVPFFLLVLLIPATVADAREMKLTIYDDGVSCPGGCDAHVVMNPKDNGTRNAYASGSTRDRPKACKVGEDCTICFGDAQGSCMATLYRGGGPPAGTFDFTPAFYEANCARGDVPSALKAQCKSLDKAASDRGYATAVNCLKTPREPRCKAVIAAAEAARQADLPKRDACLNEGEEAYNRAQANPNARRANNCNYSSLPRGGTAKKHWRLLLPAACRPGTYVDRFGLDCCSSDVRFAAANHPECVAFFPRP